MRTDENRVKNKIKEIVVQLNPNFDVLSIDDEVYLLKSGIIDSFSFMDLVLELESIFGVEIDFTSSMPDEITTISGLAKRSVRTHQA